MKCLVQCILVGLLLSLGTAMTGCEKKSDVEKAVDDKAQDAADAVKDAADDAADAVKDATGG